MSENCGSCKWWKRHDLDSTYGDCEHPLPLDPLPSSMRQISTREDEGSRCPCWQERP
jgi:hypothetical protein